MASTDRDAAPESANDPLQYERFVQLFAQTRDKLFSHIFALLPNWTDAEDVFQQTSLVLWRKFGEFNAEVKKGISPICDRRPEGGRGDLDLSPFSPADAFLAWARRVAYFEVCNFRRVASRDRLQFDDDLLGHLAEDRGNLSESPSQKRDFLMDCIAKLTADQRTLLLQAYDDAMTIQQLAEEIGRAPQTIYNRLNQIRRTLFKCVEAAMQQQKTKQ